MTDITPVFQTLGALAFAIFTAFVIPWIRKFVIPWLDSKMSADQQAELARWIGIAVEAAEQLWKGSNRGEEKKAYVVAFLAEKGYVLDIDAVSEEINALIEAAVWQLKNG